MVKFDSNRDTQSLVASTVENSTPRYFQDDEILSSQSSTSTVTSYSLSDKNISMGTSLGRKKNNKKRIDNNNGQLSKYSTFDKINGRIIQGIKSIDQEIDSL